MPDAHWLDSGAAGLSYSGRAGGMKPAMAAQPAKPPQLGGSKILGAGVPPAPGAASVPSVAARPPESTGIPTPGASTPSWGSRLWDAGNTALTATSAYSLGKQVLPKATGAVTNAVTKTLPSVAARAAPVVANTAARASPWAARAAAPLYGAYTVADGALLTPYRLATGQENLQGMQADAIHNSYLGNVMNNMARPGRAAWGLMDSTQDALRTSVGQFFRGRNLDAARRPPPVQPAQDFSGGGDF